MAVTAFVAGVAFPLLVALAPEGARPHLVGLAMPFYTFITLVVNWYITAVTWEDHQMRTRGKSDDMGS
jgi:hypothetical protein